MFSMLGQTVLNLNNQVRNTHMSAVSGMVVPKPVFLFLLVGSSHIHILDLTISMKKKYWMTMWDRSSGFVRNIIQCYSYIIYIINVICSSLLMLNPFLCLVFWLVLVFVNSSIGPVYAHLTVDVIAVPLILDNTQKPSQMLECIKGNACNFSVFCIIVG